MKKGTTTICYRFFTNLANPTRLSAIEQLMCKPMTVNEHATTLKQEQSMISNNLKPLLDCNIVFVENCGKKHVYSANHETLDPLLKTIKNHANKFCPKGETASKEKK